MFQIAEYLFRTSGPSSRDLNTPRYVLNGASKEDLEMGIELSSSIHSVDPGRVQPNTVSSLLVPGSVMSLEDFATQLRLAATASTIGRLVIQRVQLRKCKRLPFQHEYVVVFVQHQGHMYAIRLDRLGKLGSLVNGKRWHVGAFGIGGRSNDCVRIEVVGSKAGQLLIEDTNGSEQVLDLQHWSTTIKNQHDQLRLWKASTYVLADVIGVLNSPENRSHESNRRPTACHSEPTPNATTVLLARLTFFPEAFHCFSLNRADFHLGAEAQKMVNSIPHRVIGWFCLISGQEFPLSESSIRNALKLLGLDSRVQPDPISLIESLHSATRSPLTLLDLAHRLEVIHRAWPKYNLFTTNCELFSRSLCRLDPKLRFCFASNGYIHIRASGGPKEPPKPKIFGKLAIHRAVHWCAIFVGVLALSTVLCLAFFAAITVRSDNVKAIIISWIVTTVVVWIFLIIALPDDVLKIVVECGVGLILGLVTPFYIASTKRLRRHIQLESSTFAYPVYAWKNTRDGDELESGVSLEDRLISQARKSSVDIGFGYTDAQVKRKRAWTV